MISGSAARRYAKALFELGQEKGTLLGLLREVQKAAELWEGSEELRVTLTNPMIPEAGRRGAWEALIQRLGASPMGGNFLRLLYDKSRLPDLPGIARELAAMTDAKDNRLRARVISAAQLPEDVVNRMKVALQKTSGKTVMLSTEVDPSIIGGIVTRVGDLLLDGSVKTRLQRLKGEMTGRGH